MSSDAAPKLTKKQRKSVAFRERKTKKGGKPVAADLPELEDQDAAELELDTESQTPVGPKLKLDKKDKGKATPAPQAVAEDATATAAPSSSATKSSKRKRDPAAADEGVDAHTIAKPAKVTKKQKTEAESTEEGDTRRKILFLGPLPLH
jgi:nucleolar protein 6